MLKRFVSEAWTPGHAAHLLARAGFGGTPAQVDHLYALGLEGAVEALLEGGGADASPPPPVWTADARTARAALEAAAMEGSTGGGDRSLREQAAAEDRKRMRELRSWWLAKMRYGGDPLREKMTLFWHGHFATSISKVQFPYAMWRQNEMLRENALGSLRTLLVGISRDPAMIRWLDLNKSTRQRPNENFGRELLELFTLGEGHYTEADIQAAARAFTGHQISSKTKEFRFVRKAHDSAEKTFMGRRGGFDGVDIIEIILEQPQCARFVTGRIWEFFVHPAPDPQTLDAAAGVLRENGFAMKPLFRAIFTSEAFYSERVIRACIKSPVQWLVQACIELERDLPEQPALDGILSQLGQVPFAPPNVRGWEGGRSWINSSTLVLRYNLAGYVTGLANLPNAKSRKVPRPLEVAGLVPGPKRRDPEALADALLLRLFGTRDLPRVRERAMEAMGDAPVSNADVRRLFKLLMSTPDYQLT